MARRRDCRDIGILLVDDEASFRVALAEMLRDDGHEVRDYGLPADVPSLQDLVGVAILVTDYQMPGKTGLDLAEEFHAHHPGTPVVLVTAYQTPGLDTQAVDRPYLRIVQKPVDYDAIHALIHAVA